MNETNKDTVIFLQRVCRRSKRSSIGTHSRLTTFLLGYSVRHLNTHVLASRPCRKGKA